METAFYSVLLLLFAVGTFWTALKGFVIVPQSQKYVIERLGKYRTTLGPGLNFIVPWIDRVRREVSILERPISDLRQHAITKDNVVLDCQLAVFYRVVEPERMVYRIADIDQAVKTTISGIVRSEIGKIDLDGLQSNREELNDAIREELREATQDWGVVITRAEVLDVELDEATRSAMMQQIAADREKRASVTRAEGERRSIELKADAELYSAERLAEARRLTAEADAYAAEKVAAAITSHGLQALEFEIRKRQVAAMEKLGSGEGARTIFLPTDLADAFGDAAKLFGKR